MRVGNFEFSRYWSVFAIVREHHNGPGVTFGYWPRKQWAVHVIKSQPFY